MFIFQAYFSALGDVKQFNLNSNPSSAEGVNGKKTYFIEYFDDRCASKAWLDITQAEVSTLSTTRMSVSSLNTVLTKFLFQ